MKPDIKLDQLLCPRYPAMASLRLASLFVDAAMKALGGNEAFEKHKEKLNQIRIEIDAQRDNPERIDATIH